MGPSVCRLSSGPRALNARNFHSTGTPRLVSNKMLASTGLDALVQPAPLDARGFREAKSEPNWPAAPDPAGGSPSSWRDSKPSGRLHHQPRLA